MTKRSISKRAKLAASLLVATSATVAGVAATSPRAHATPRRNVVVVEVDDMRTDELPYMTKTLARLQGTTFSKSYVSTSLCCPSRAAFLSGQYSQNNKVQNNSGFHQFDQANTLATWLHNSGYFTSIIGKYLNGYGCASPTPPGWDHWQALCSNIYSMLSYKLKDGANLVSYGNSAADYQTDVLSARATATITEANATGKPFFIWLTPTAPHTGPGGRFAARYKNAFATYKLPVTANRPETDVTDKPAWIQAKPVISTKGFGSIRQTEIGRLRMLAAADDLVASVVSQLSAVGQLANTDVIFTSDNGYMRGEHRLTSGKEVGYEESVSVPLVASGPDFPIATSNELVQNTDLAPTIADISGVVPGRVVDGRSLLPIATGASWPQRVIRHFVTQDSTGDGGSANHPRADGVRTSRFSYFQLATGEQELYDHQVDPLELTNKIGDPSYKSAQARLASINTTLKTCAGITCQIDIGNLAPTASETALCPNLVCTFDASQSGDLDGSIISYHWDFGDGTSATSPNPSVTHSY